MGRVSGMVISSSQGLKKPPKLAQRVVEQPQFAQMRRAMI